MAKSSPILDLAHLARYTGGDTALNAEILRLFDSQTGELVERLRSTLTARDAQSWKMVAHTIKGAARGVGAFPLSDAAAAAEPLDPCADDAGAALETLSLRAEAVQAFIRTYLAA